ncbi:NUDIX domain-containing protein [Streptomyces griseus]|uniref:NUDIX domain-containing protein n=1 Tax=Streptomyces griseus TaxID=1911 RepID=UPI000AAA4AA4|nr:NUDIX domain-containing protein [Streptomyces griseus]
MPPSPAHIRELVTDYLDRHPDERPALGPLLETLDASHEVTYRTLPGHITCSAAVIDHDGRVLHVRHIASGGKWLLPGGHVEPEDATLMAAAVREVHEETGIPPAALCQSAAFCHEPAEQRPAPTAVFTPPADPADHARMRRTHAAAARTLHVRAHGPSTWGFRGRTLGRRADEGRWLRVVSVPLGKPRSITWDGTVHADTLLPRAVPRPRVDDLLEWTDPTHRYRAELSEYLPRPALQSGGPVLTRELDLPDSWWADLRAALTATAAVPTGRQAVRQQWIDRHFHRLLGIPTIQVASWTTGHGDLHVGNLLPPPLVIVDWEGWGRMPAGFDVGLFFLGRLRSVSLPIPRDSEDQLCGRPAPGTSRLSSLLSGVAGAAVLG